MMENNRKNNPSREDVCKVWILDVRFKIDYNTGVEGCPENPLQFRAYCEAGGTETWAKVPGLRSKYFTLKQDEQHGSGIYIFLTKRDLDNYVNSDLFKNFGAFPHIIEIDVKTYRVLKGSEETVDMTPWASGNVTPTREDIESVVIFYPRFNVDYDTGLEGTPSNPEEFEAALIEPMNFAKMWHNSNVPGLQSKYFTLGEDAKRGTGLYIFQNQRYLDAYLESELLSNFKGFPHIKDLQVDIYNIIGGTELTVAVNPWR